MFPIGITDQTADTPRSQQMASNRINRTRLIEAMERAGIGSDAELARRLGLDARGAPGKWKRGETTPAGDTLARLCRVLEVTPAYLFGEDEPAPDQLEQILPQLTPEEREVLLATAEAMVRRRLSAPTPTEKPARGKKTLGPKVVAPPSPLPQPGRHR